MSSQIPPSSLNWKALHDGGKAFLDEYRQSQQTANKNLRERNPLIWAGLKVLVSANTRLATSNGLPKPLAPVTNPNYVFMACAYAAGAVDVVARHVFKKDD